MKGSQRNTRIRNLLMILVLSLIVAGCGLSFSSSPKTVVDYFGREIAVPEKVERIFSTYYVQAEYLCAMGARDKIIGVGRIYANDYIIENFCPEVYDLPQIAQGGLNLESLVEMQPDIVLTSNNMEQIESIENLGIPVFGSFPDSTELIFQQIMDTGVIAGYEKQARQIVDFQQDLLDKVDAVVGDLSEDQRPGVYYLRDEALQTQGKGVMSDIIARAGGRNVAEQLGESGEPVMVSMENIYDWNPDIIIIRDRSALTPQDVYNDPLWASINAVKNQQVYQEHYGWTEFRTETIFGILEKAKWFQPDLFASLDVDAEYQSFLELIQSFYE